MAAGIVRALFVSLGLAALFAAAAAAQDRPTLERIETGICVAAEVRGDSYRPVFCEPRCDCLAGMDLAQVVTCAETSPGVVLVASAPGPATGSSVCFGTCSNGDACSELYAECPLSCNTVGCGDTGGPCTSPVQCDQAQGFSCVDGYCVAASSCSLISQTCPQNTQRRAVGATFGFAPGGDPMPLSCDVAGVGIMNSSDAAACLALVEAELGAGACVICGDGNLDAGEQCDDGNLIPGDGCAADCTTEP